MNNVKRRTRTKEKEEEEEGQFVCTMSQGPPKGTSGAGAHFGGELNQPLFNPGVLRAARIIQIIAMTGEADDDDDGRLSPLLSSPRLFFFCFLFDNRKHKRSYTAQ